MNRKPHAVLTPMMGAALLISIAACKGLNTSPPSVSTVLSPAPIAGGPPSSGEFSDAIFLHHSVGNNLIEQGNLRGLLTDRGFQFWDQGYNQDGLRMPDGTKAPYDYNVPEDNTDPDGLAKIFTQTVDPLSLTSDGSPANTLTGLLRHKVIIFKSCYPVTEIQSDAQLEQYKAYYRQIRATVDQYPDRLFIALTPPPQDPGDTTRQTAERARAFANWLKSPEYLSGHPNLFAIDLFDMLAENSPSRSDYNTLRLRFRDDAPGFKATISRPFVTTLDFFNVGANMGKLWMPGDSHPNATANKAIAPTLADAIAAATRTFEATLVSAGRG